MSFSRPKSRLLWIAGALLLGLAALLAFTHPGRVAVKTALFVPQVLPNAPVHPQEWFAAEPLRQEVRFLTGGEPGTGDLYRPARGGRFGAMLLFLGVNPAGRDDPRVVNLGKALARAGMAVLIPWSGPMTEKRIEPEEVARLVSAFQYLRGQEFVDPTRVGMGGFCVGASLALVASADPRIRDQVAFLNFFGGYYDATDLLRQVSSRARFYGDRAQPWAPAELTREVVTQHLLSSVADPSERGLLAKRFLSPELEEPGGSAQPIPPPGPLSPHAQAVSALLHGVPLAEVDGYVKLLPEGAQESLRRISPSAVAAQLRARVFIMHDQQDSLVPADESRRLFDALKARGRVSYTEFSFFQHMDPTRPVGPLTFVREAAKLYLHTYRILLAGA